MTTDTNQVNSYYLKKMNKYKPLLVDEKLKETNKKL